MSVMACHVNVCWGNDLESIGDFIPDVFSALHVAASEIGSDLLKTKFCRPFVSIFLARSPWQISMYNMRLTCVMQPADCLLHFLHKGFLSPVFQTWAMLPTCRSFACTSSDMYLQKSETSMRQVYSVSFQPSLFFSQSLKPTAHSSTGICNGGNGSFRHLSGQVGSRLLFRLRPAACMAHRNDVWNQRPLVSLAFQHFMVTQLSLL